MPSGSWMDGAWFLLAVCSEGAILAGQPEYEAMAMPSTIYGACMDLEACAKLFGVEWDSGEEPSQMALSMELNKEVASGLAMAHWRGSGQGLHSHPGVGLVANRATWIPMERENRGRVSVLVLEMELKAMSSGCGAEAIDRQRCALGLREDFVKMSARATRFDVQGERLHAAKMAQAIDYARTVAEGCIIASALSARAAHGRPLKSKSL